MTRIERVQAAIRHQPGAGIPTGELTMDRSFLEALLTGAGQGGLLNKVSAMSDTQMLVEGCRLLDHDLVCLQSNPAGSDGRDPSVSLRRIPQLVDADLFVFWIVDGAFQRTLRRQDFMAFMRALAASPDAVAEEMENASLIVTAGIEQGVRHGAHGMIIADDIAYQAGPYMSPEFGRRYLLPIWRRQTLAARALNVPVFFHSDGNINRFMPLVVEAGFDGLQCIEPAAGMDIFSIGRTYGSRLCLMGNIDPSLLCGTDNPDTCDRDCRRLDRAVADLLAGFGDRGGLILGTSSGLHSGMSPDRVCRMAALASKMK
jgi:uroporphyrinogen decarboxylase